MTVAEASKASEAPCNNVSVYWYMGEIVIKLTYTAYLKRACKNNGHFW